MRTEAENAELLSLVKDVREHVTYFKELGVDGMEKTSPGIAANAAPTPATQLSAAAVVPAGATSAKATPAVTSRQIPPKQAPASPSSDTLFGDLSARPVRIQKSSETFEEIWADIGDCTRCPLYQGRTNIVNSDGNRKAPVDGAQ